ncbi:putative exportin-7-like [Apostichopus japonicus]|uniref:Putative exportin-7-like n=1 Tax=Stichopus japonicus TaxID=307972 RepID=A0A2G8LND5_STIJA|nr:putative exportin-7-like [Apostichopus japonicus]
MCGFLIYINRCYQGNYVLNYLGTRLKLPAFVTQALIQLLTRLTKLGWNDNKKDDMVFRNVVEDVSKFLQGSVEHFIIGVQLMSQLVAEMNQPDNIRPLTRHRKIASSFRDTVLFDIFTMACNLLKQASEEGVDYNDEQKHSVMNQLLQLTRNCLTFDFIGTITDESSDDLCTVQIPTAWRSAFLDSSTIHLFFGLYKALPHSLSALALTCLVQIASVRRSLFNNAERAKFLSELVTGVRTILESPQAPVWQFAPNSIHYLLTLWQRMVASVPYVKATEPHMLEVYTPEVTKAYITSRLDSVVTVLREGQEDPLDDTAIVLQQLDQLSTIGRCEYEKTCALLIQLFDTAAQEYQKLAQTSTSAMDLAVQEGRLTWLVYIIGAVIGGRVSFTSVEEHDGLDGELVCRVLQLMNITDAKLSTGGSEKLDLAMLSFFEQFSKIYLGNQVQKSSKLYRTLSQVLGLQDESMVLSVFIGKIITNLKYWGQSEPIISKTLQLLSDLSVGYSSVRKLVKLEAVQFVLANHTSSHFPFLGVNGTLSVYDMRCRTTFYTALGRLLMVDLGEDEERFDTFMVPLTTAFEYVGSQLANADKGGPWNETETKRTLIGLARDLRGITFAFNTKVSYMMLFEWIYPSYTPILLRAVELWYHDPAVTTPVLKLMAELVQNRSQRLQFDVSSPNGILLFRETSKMIAAYGISVCFAMLKAALSGSYVNFGVFRLYGDNALDEALQMFIKLLLSVPLKDLLDFPKLSQSYYGLVECLAQDHMNFIATLEAQLFLHILSSISEGLTALDTMVCTGCCATLDHIVTYLFKQLHKTGKNKNDQFPKIMDIPREILQQMLSTVLNIIMFEECRNQWSMSRPLLGLILLNEEYFTEFQQSVVSAQSPEKQTDMLQCFKNLMEGIERNLRTKNRDKFTQNLSIFRRDINDSLRTANDTARNADNSSVGLDMMS